MALFTDDQPDHQAPRRRGRRIGWLLLVIAVVGTLAFSLVPSPYLIERPGPVFNTLGTVTLDHGTVPMISIPTEETYPTRGTFDMLTVDLVGNREQPPNFFEVISAWFDPARAVVPLDSVYPVGYTLQDSTRDGAIEMANSQKDAIAAALTELGYHLPSTVTVAGFSPKSPSAGILKNGDEILDVNGSAVKDVPGLKAAIATSGVGKPLSLAIRRAGQDQTVTVVPELSGGTASAPIIGIYPSVDYTLPFEVKIQLENVGGPSAGSMFALGIIDKLTPGALNGGRKVAGTGTIDSDGTIGPIGGIRQKLYGAVGAGAKWFLAPYANCNEVTGHVPSGLKVLAVRNLDDSLAALKAISTGAGTGTLPTCPTN